MKNIVTWLVLFVSLSSYFCTSRKSQSTFNSSLEPCSSGGSDSTLRCGTLSVFENPKTNSGRKIDLNVVVIPAIHKNTENAPIFMLEGGPGAAATNDSSYYADSINFYRVNFDIVLLDVRGTGKSNPLHCRQLQFKKNLEEQLTEMYPLDAVKACYDSLSLNADLTQYNTTNMAIDIEVVRKWLGYEKINLFGLSFGTRLAQVYMKMFPASVESCVLWSPTTTYSKMPLYHAAFAEESMSKLMADCEKDSLCATSFPNFKYEFEELTKRGKEGPFTSNFKSQNGKTRNVNIPWFAFQTKIRSLMYMPFGLRQIPHLVHQSYLGNWQPFLSLFPDASSYDDFIAEGLYLCVTCIEDVPFISEEDADLLTKGTFMGRYRIDQQQGACKNWVNGVVPADYFEPLTSSIPTLVFSGYFDPVTPPSMAEQIVSTLNKSFLVTIPAMSHTFDGLSNPECFDKLVLEFYTNPSVRPNSECVNEMKPEPYKTE